jgi:glycosyltransferase involved in cell wall biosynthesis
MEKFEKGLVSIIIPVFNRELLLPETLNSIIAQTYLFWECIIVDDGSSDSSLSIAMEYASNDERFKVYTRPWYKKKGANTCRNYGFELSKGEFIQWFDSDDIMLSEMIQNKVVSFQINYCDIVVCGASFFSLIPNLNIRELDISIAPKTSNPAFEYFAGNFWFGTPQAMIKKNVINNLPYIFNQKLKRNQETELYVRFFLDDLKFYYINQVLILIRVHDFSISGHYLSIDESRQLELDLDAYISLFLEFKKRNKLNPEVLYFFSNYFFRSLKKVNHNRFQILKIYFFGIFWNLFPSRRISSKILLYRLIKNV